MWLARSVTDVAQSARKGFSQLADVIASRDTMFSNHGVNDFARSEHVGFFGGKNCAEVSLIGTADAGQ